MANPEQHFYTPQNQIANLIDVEVLGLFKLGDLPSYYQPTDDAKVFTERLINRILNDPEVQMVVSDEAPSKNCVMTDAERIPGRLTSIVGPAGLEDALGGDSSSPSSWLWDHGNYEQALKEYWITEDAA